MKDYVNAMYSYLLDIDLYFKGNDEETINIIKELKKKLDEYVKQSDLDKLSEVENAFQEFYKEGQIKSKYSAVKDKIDNLGEMIFRTKRRLNNIYS